MTKIYVNILIIYESCGIFGKFRLKSTTVNVGEPLSFDIRLVCVMM